MSIHSSVKVTVLPRGYVTRSTHICGEHLLDAIYLGVSCMLLLRKQIVDECMAVPAEFCFAAACSVTRLIRRRNLVAFHPNHLLPTDGKNPAA